MASDFTRYGITAFVPTTREVHRWSDRRKIVEVPLFSCYMFVNVPGWRQVHSLVVRTPGFLQWVGANGEPTAIPDAQIEAVRCLLTNGFAASRYPFLKLGQRVRVRGGCLDGIEGILVRKSDNSQLVVSIDLIQACMSVTLHGYELEPLP